MIKLINDDILNIDFSELPLINLVVCSPPYNVGIEYDKHVDTMTYYDYLKWCAEWLNVMYNVMADDGRICINIPFSVTPVHLNKKKGAEDINYPVSADYTRIAQEVGFKYYRNVIWQKMGSNKTCWGSWRSASAPFIIDPNECILIFYKEQWKRKNKGTSTVRGREFMTYVKNLWHIHPETQSKHPAAFPLELPNRCIKLLSYEGDVVCDPFLGCYDEKTEVLTYEGWKSFPLLLPTDKVLTRAKDGRLEYQATTKHYAYQYNDKMVRIESRSTDLLVTPNHNMYVKTHNDFCNNQPSQLIPASNLHLQVYRVPMGGKYMPPNDIIPKEIMYLIGLYVSEGYFANWRDKKKLTICQNQGQKIKQMMEWVRPFHPRLKGKRHFVVDLDERWTQFILQNCGESKYSKHLSPIILNNKHLNCLFDAMMLGDGCTSKSSKGYWSQRYFTVSPKLAEGFEELCLKLGYGTTTTNRIRENGGIIEGRQIHSTVPCYEIGICHSEHKKILQKHIGQESYSGMVYCVEVPNHTLYVKRNGHCTWCGNSGTTGDAAVRLKRSFIGVEKSEEYFKMAKERIDTAELQTSLIKSIMPDGDEDDD